jgi:HD-GYP domain-containing protein (c-di-GMP phosphodiesterase class II)
MSQSLQKWLYLFDTPTQHAISSLMDRLSCHDGGETYRHALSVAQLSGCCAEAMALPATVIEETIIVGLLHDIGTVSDSTHRFSQVGGPSVGTIEFLDLHPVVGERILQAVPGLYLAGRAVRAHHERWDGHGCPDRLRAHQIPLSARIVSVADAFDSLTDDRPGQPGLSVTAALAELERHSGTHFDPAIVLVFCDMMRRTSHTELLSYRQVQVTSVRQLATAS